MMKNYLNKIMITVFLTMLVAPLQNMYGQAITYSIENARMTDGNGNPGVTHYEADVMFTTDTDLKLGSGQFYINYNTAAFGTFIGPLGSGNFTSMHPAAPAVGDPEYIVDGDALDAISLYSNFIVNDNTASRLSMAWIQGQNGPFYPTLTAGSPHKLLHLNILYVDNTQDPGITFDALSDDQAFTAASTPTTPDGTQLTNDTRDSSGFPIANWAGGTDTDWNTVANWLPNAVPTAASNVTIPNTTNKPTTTGAISVRTLNLDANAALTVNGAVTTSFGDITINSGASFIAQTSVSGNIVYKRNLGTNNWYLVSSPVVGETIEDFITNHALATGTATNIGLASYGNDGTAWNYQAATSTGPLAAGTGYSVKLQTAGDISFTGTMPVADVGVTLTSNTTGLNLIGNPFPSYMTANNTAPTAGNNILTANTSILEQETIWFWDQAINNYQQINQATALIDGIRYIAPGQGFFVESKVGGGTFNLTEAMQSHQSTDVFSRSTNTIPRIKLVLDDGSTERTTDILYIDGTTTGFDNGYDSSIFSGADNSFVIYSHLVNDGQGQNLGIQSLPNSDYENMIIPIGIHAASGTQITLSATALDLPEGIDIYLEDKDENVFTLLNDATNYSITLNENLNGIGRFYLHTTSSALSIDDAVLKNLSVYASSRDNLRIIGIQDGDAQISMYNILGKQVVNTTFQGNGVNNIAIPNLRTGVYIVQVETKTGKLNKKIIIE